MRARKFALPSGLVQALQSNHGGNSGSGTHVLHFCKRVLLENTKTMFCKRVLDNMSLMVSHCPSFLQVSGHSSALCHQDDVRFM